MSYQAKIHARIKRYKPQTVFVAADFADLADINTVWQGLSRLEKANEITRIMRGVYHRPSSKDQTVAPQQLALALARKCNWTLVPSGATVLYLMGFSNQIPASWSYISSGPYRKYTFDTTAMVFKHCSSKELAGLSPLSAQIIQLLRALGKNKITPDDLARIRASLSDRQRRTIFKETQNTTAWIYDYIKQICQTEGSDKSVSI